MLDFGIRKVKGKVAHMARKKLSNDDELLAELLGDDFDEKYADREMPEENVVDMEGDGEGDGEGEEYPPNYIDSAGFARYRRMTKWQEIKAMNRAMIATLKKRAEEGYEDGGVVDEECLALLNVVGGRLLMEQLKAARKCAGMTQVAVALRSSGKHHPMTISKYEVGSGIPRAEREKILGKEAPLGMNLRTLIGLLAVYGLGLKLEIVDYGTMLDWVVGMEEKLEDGSFILEPGVVDTLEDWEKTHEVRMMEWDAEDMEGKLLPGQFGRKEGEGE